MEENKEIPEKAMKHIEKLEDINYKIDEFIDLTLHGEIRDFVENMKEKTELLNEEQNYKYIETELVLDRAMTEIEKAIDSITEIYTNELF